MNEKTANIFDLDGNLQKLLATHIKVEPEELTRKTSLSILYEQTKTYCKEYFDAHYSSYSASMGKPVTYDITQTSNIELVPLKPQEIIKALKPHRQDLDGAFSYCVHESAVPRLTPAMKKNGAEELEKALNKFVDDNRDALAKRYRMDRAMSNVEIY